jgi:hypothetical protein
MEPPMSFRIVNTKDALKGPLGTRYVHDAARPFAVLFDKGRGETCAGRYSTEHGAKSAVARFTASCQRYADRHAVEPRTAAGSLD